MKTNYFRFSLLAVAAAFLAGCSQEDALENMANEQVPQALTISATANNFDAADAETRVAENGAQTVFETGDQMGLYVLEGNATDGYTGVTLRNIPLTYTAPAAGETTGKWDAGRTIYYYEGCDYIAYFPYDATLSSSVEASKVIETITKAFDAKIEGMATTQTKETYRAADLMMATITGTSLATDNNATKALNFNLKHNYSMIELTLPVLKYSYMKGTETVNYNIAMNGIKIKIGSNECTPYEVTPGTYRMLMKPGNVTVSGSFTDPQDQRPVTFTSTAKSLTAGSYVGYTVKVKNSDGTEVNYNNVTSLGSPIGHYYCQDGTIYPNNLEVVPDNVVGIIFAEVGDGEFANNPYDYYAISVAKRALGFTVKSNVNTTDNVKYAHFDNVTTVASTSSLEDMSKCFEDYAGLASTSVLSDDANICMIKNNLESLWNNADAFKLPTTTSGWFIPGMGQWKKFLEMGGSTITFTYGSEPKLTATTQITSLATKINDLVAKLPLSLKSDYKELTIDGLFWSSTQGPTTSVAENGSVPAYTSSKAFVWDAKSTSNGDGQYKVVINLQNKNSDNNRNLCPIFAF